MSSTQVNTLRSSSMPIVDKDPIHKTMKNVVCTRPAFEGNLIHSDVRHKLSSAIKRVFPETEFHILPST